MHHFLCKLENHITEKQQKQCTRKESCKKSGYKEATTIAKQKRQIIPSLSIPTQPGDFFSYYQMPSYNMMA